MVAAAIEDVGLSRDVLDRYPHQFSGGQRQRIAIARAIVARPRLLLADEAVSALDLSTRVRIVDLFREIAARMTLLFVSHDLGVVAALCDRIVVLDRGRIVEAGPTRRVACRPAGRLYPRAARRDPAHARGRLMYLDRDRAERLMDEAGVAALVLFSPENVHYATGVHPGPTAMWRRAGGGVAVVPARADLRVTAILSDFALAASPAARALPGVLSFPAWVDFADARDLPPDADLAALTAAQPAMPARPATYDRAVVLRLVADALAGHGLTDRRVAVDMDFLPARDLPALPFRDVADGTDLVRALRLVKSAAEVAHLREAARLAEAGLVLLRDALAEGVTTAELVEHWRGGVVQAAGIAPPTWAFVSAGPDPWGAPRRLRPGDLVKADVGCIVEGYSSDGARTFVLDKPSPLAARAFAALEAGFAAGLALFRPGTAFDEIFRATRDTIRAAGLTHYDRGHVGHSVGSAVGIEEWPFISADSPVVLAPGMVLAFETPLYADGLGALMIEDQILVTEDGHEAMNRLPRGLCSNRHQ